MIRAWRTPEDLAREFEPTAQSISNWVAQADRDVGRQTDGLTTAERTELTQLRRENRQLKIEREIVSTAAAWFAQETPVNTKRVARLMRAAASQGLPLRRFVTTTVGDPAADRAVDQVDRQFTADGPDRLWVADITYVPTWTGFLYLAIVLDVWFRRIVGWAMEPHLTTELGLSALNMALAQRRPEAVIAPLGSRLSIYQLYVR